jgi:hypothetical protein
MSRTDEGHIRDALSGHQDVLRALLHALLPDGHPSKATLNRILDGSRDDIVAVRVKGDAARKAKEATE